MPPGIRLEIIVDDKGTPVVRQFNQEVAKSPAAVEKSGQSFAASGASALGFATALTGVQLGIQGLAAGIQAAVSAVVGFEAALANVNTLGIRSVGVQQQLRAELLQLPAVLGSSTELATGLYEVLSSGIEPAKAVAFLEESAKLAAAGLASLDVTTVALTKTMAAYNIPAEKAGAVSDLLFKTVEVGQGTLQQFAGAMPTVTALSASLGVSLEDTAAVMATLSQTFRNADTAATGYRSLLTQLIQNSEKFLALGIDIKQIISEQGLLGVVKTLREVSQGTSEGLKTFVNDIEGLNAAVALTGPQFKTFETNQKKFQETTGAVSAALKEQGATTASAWKEFTGTIDRSAQALGPAVTGTLTTILKGGTAFVQEFNKQVLLIPTAVEQTKLNLDKLVPAFAQSIRDLLQVPLGGPSLNDTLGQQHERIRAACGPCPANVWGPDEPGHRRA